MTSSYTMVLEDLRTGRLRSARPASARATVTHDDVRRATAVRGLLLMEGGRPGCAVHPLVAERVLPLLSRSVRTMDYLWLALPEAQVPVGKLAGQTTEKPPPPAPT